MTERTRKNPSVIAFRHQPSPTALRKPPGTTIPAGRVAPWEIIGVGSRPFQENGEPWRASDETAWFGEVEGFTAESAE